MSSSLSAKPSKTSWSPGRYCIIALYGAAILLLVSHFALYLRGALAAVHDPFELDYGEGIVWQQALLIPGDRMYGDINHFPFIVFHYPPLFHLAVRGVIALGGDALAAGRGISLLCTLVTGGLAAALAYDVVRSNVPRAAGFTGAAVAGLTVFCYWPIVFWSMLMRVDMMAVALSFLGVWLAARSFRRPWLLYLAVLSFVLAVYTKQTSIAAPLAVLLIGLAVDRRATVKAYGLGLLLGLIALAALTWTTDGGFLRHIVLYNLNRYSIRTAIAMVLGEWPQSLFLILALGGVVAGWAALAGGLGLKRSVSSPGRIGQAAATRLMSVLTLYLVITTGMIASTGKSGAGPNYLIEWMCIWSVLIGVLVASALAWSTSDDGLGDASTASGKRTALASLLPVLLLVQVMIMPTQWYDVGADPERDRQLGELVTQIRDATRPVLSDDMVLLLKAGKQVPWEPAIFAELATNGRWDERLITNMITARAFAFVITQGHSGTPLYDRRFTPAVDRAIGEAYPRTKELGGRTLHFPPT